MRLSLIKYGMPEIRMTHISIYYVAKEMYYPINLFNETIYDYLMLYISNSVIRKKFKRKSLNKNTTIIPLPTQSR